MNLIQKLASVHLQKLANSFTYRKENITIKTILGDREVPAQVYKNWGIHKASGSSGWAITLIPTGLQLPRIKPRTREDAQSFLEALLTEFPILTNANSADDVKPYVSRYMELADSHVSTSKALRVPRVSDMREDLIRKLKEMGLREMGERSGKAGTFFSWGYETPAWAISVGNRDVILNQFQLESRMSRGYESWGGRWVLVDSELISKMPPEKLEKWVNALKRAPTRKELQDEKRRR